jgi:hypothetical protein
MVPCVVDHRRLLTPYCRFVRKSEFVQIRTNNRIRRTRLLPSFSHQMPCETYLSHCPRDIASLRRSQISLPLTSSRPAVILILDLTSRHRLPAIHIRRFFVDEGGLVSYRPMSSISSQRSGLRRSSVSLKADGPRRALGGILPRWRLIMGGWVHHPAQQLTPPSNPATPQLALNLKAADCGLASWAGIAKRHNDLRSKYESNCRAHNQCNSDDDVVQVARAFVPSVPSDPSPGAPRREAEADQNNCGIDQSNHKGHAGFGLLKQHDSLSVLSQCTGYNGTRP